MRKLRTTPTKPPLGYLSLPLLPLPSTTAHLVFVPNLDTIIGIIDPDLAIGRTRLADDAD